MSGQIHVFAQGVDVGDDHRLGEPGSVAALRREQWCEAGAAEPVFPVAPEVSIDDKTVAIDLQDIIPVF